MEDMKQPGGLTLEEKLNWLQYQKQSRRVSAFHTLKPFLTEDVIRVLGLHEARRMGGSHAALPGDCPGKGFRTLLLRDLLPRVERSGRYELFKAVFAAADVIPPPVLAKFWLSCYDFRPGIDCQELETPDGHANFGYSVADPELLASLAVTDPMLIDNRAALFRYCQIEKPGWQFLRYVHGRRATTLRLPEVLRESIREDAPETFAMFMDMSGVNLSFSLLDEILKKNASRIFGHLLRQGKIVEKVIALPELCGWITACFPDQLAIPLLDHMEAVHPGILRDMRDPFGRNLLWYAVQNLHTAFFHPQCLLTPYLLEHGCSAENRNTAGLAWKEIIPAMTLAQKEAQMRVRYNFQRHALPVPADWMLTKTQTLAALQREKHVQGK